MMMEDGGGIGAMGVRWVSASWRCRRLNAPQRLPLSVTEYEYGISLLANFGNLQEIYDQFLVV
jgi:hypothetical protein